MNLVNQFEQEQLAKLTANKTIPDFRVGDTVTVSVKVMDGKSARTQLFQGVVIAKKFKQQKSINSSFIVRKISGGEGIERRFMTYSPLVEKIEIIRRGIVRRAKLFYLRNRAGKSARIKENVLYRTSNKNKPVKNTEKLDMAVAK